MLIVVSRVCDNTKPDHQKIHDCEYLDMSGTCIDPAAGAELRASGPGCLM